MYIELLKKCLLDCIYNPTGSRVYTPGQLTNLSDKVVNVPMSIVEEGRYWPKRAHTMIGYKRLNNIQHCFESIIKDEIDGDLIETGVWRGGATIFMQGLNRYYNQNRKIYVADSFEGLPKPDKRYPSDEGDDHHSQEFLKVSIEEVTNNFQRYDLLDDNVLFVKGFFEDTLHLVPIEKLAILRMDGDMYSSTIQTLNALYHKVSVGGYIIVDDYALKGCRAAVADFRKEHNITDPIEHIDYMGSFWSKLT